MRKLTAFSFVDIVPKIRLVSRRQSYCTTWVDHKESHRIHTVLNDHLFCDQVYLKYIGKD